MWAAVVPDWLAEVVRPKPAPLPWPDMIRAALAICVPLSVAFAVGRGTIGVLPAMGGLMGTMSDTGGSYVNRVKRVTAAAVLGRAAGLARPAVSIRAGPAREGAFGYPELVPTGPRIFYEARNFHAKLAWGTVGRQIADRNCE